MHQIQLMASWYGSLVLLERCIDSRLNFLLVDEDPVNTASVIQVRHPVLRLELDHSVEAGSRGVLQNHVTPRGSPKLEAALVVQVQLVYDLAILHCLQLEMRPAS